MRPKQAESTVSKSQAAMKQAQGSSAKPAGCPCQGQPVGEEEDGKYSHYERCCSLQHDACVNAARHGLMLAGLLALKVFVMGNSV